MTAVTPDMHARITRMLTDIAVQEGATILFAIESGSRAWGFHSPDSDYDVRFVYTRPLTWHFHLGKKRDVIERPIDDALDISGWELSKALTLAMGSNAVIAEWLQSPIVYMADREAVAALTAFVERALDRKSVTWHYLSLVQRQRAKLQGTDGGVRIKPYFYVLRPVLALRWMRLSGGAMPPMNMDALRAEAQLSRDVADALDRLTAQKMVARERATMGVADPILDALVEQEIEAAEAWLKTAPSQDNRPLWDEANRLHMALSGVG